MGVIKQTSDARFLAWSALERIERDAAYSDIVLSHLLHKSELSVRDRAFVSELVRGSVRWKKRLDWIVDQLFSGASQQLSAKVRWILRLGLYQLEYMRTPEFAAVNESVKLARRLKLHRWTGVINGILRNFVRHHATVTFPDPNVAPVAWLAVTESFPEWLLERWINQFGFETAKALCRANNTAPDLSVRPNSLRISDEQFVEQLKSNDVQFCRAETPGFFSIQKIDLNFRDQLLRDGLMTIQDASAGIPVLLADPKPGQVVFDLCAAPGGKSMFAAEIMMNQGLVISGDKNIARTGLIQKAAARLEHDSIHTVAADALHFPAKQADVVLLDAPCSGLGVVRKKPDLRWRKKESDIIDLHKLQVEMIHKAGQLVKAGGSLVYSTCSIDRDENEAVVADLLKSNKNFELDNPDERHIASQFITSDGFIRTWPHKHFMDGSFAAKLIKRF